jgi:hypothetical protein
MSPTPPLTIRAGATARSVLAERGFEPDAFSTLVGASGGPKWLVLRQLDELLAERFVAGRVTPLATLGSSIGSYRHACLARSDPRTALARFFEAYVGQCYEGTPTLDDVTGESARVLEYLLEEKGAEEVVSNPNVHTHIVASRLRGGGADAGLGFRLRIGASAAANALGRGSLRHFYERAVFGPEESRIAYSDLATRHVPLTVENLRGALLASGAIPMLMRGVRDIPGAGGTWFDGGILDYHFDFEFESPQGLMLFPHFFDRITPGWFDKALPWRKPRAAALDRVVMLAPSVAFVASLPGGKVPDRKDFVELSNDARIERWHAVDTACGALAEDLADLIDGNRWASRVQPFD